MEDTQPTKPTPPAKLTYRSAKAFIEKTRELLKEEEKFQIELFNDLTKNKTIQEIETTGFGLANMQVVSSKRGFYGKTILTLTRIYSSEKNPQPLPEECKIGVGDDVALFKNNTVVVDGIVSKRLGPKLQISIRSDIDDDNDFEGLNCNVVLKWNEVTFRRYFFALKEMQASSSPLLDLFFPFELPLPGLYTREVEYSNSKLNELQNEAVQHCIGETVHLLHGPPGTGKTTTVCEVIVEAVRRKQKVLACAPSNIAVDNIVEGLSKRVNCIRIGNPARIIQTVIESCLDFQISKSSNTWKNQVKKLQIAKKKLSKGGNREERRALKYQIKSLRDEIYQMQEQVIKQILSDTDVICCTNVGAADRVFRRYLPKRVFDLVVIDECGQSLQVSCWIPILKGRRVVLAGDHKQLPPTIQGNVDSLLSHTLFTRAMQQLKNITSTMLKVQYRMNKQIMGWSNEQFYDNQLTAHQSVQSHTLRHLYGGVAETEEILMMVDTSGCGMGQEGQQNESKLNMGQADIAVSIYKKLLAYQVEARHVAILTPYSKQVSFIKSLINEANISIPDVSTVDGIQGREKECIIMSLVRSNSRREIGFLKDWRRMNVAVTRARRMLILIGNVDCVTADKNIATLVRWVEQNGHVCSAEEFREDPSIRFGVGVSDKIQKYDKANVKVKGEQSDTKQASKKKRKPKGHNQHNPDKEHSEQQQKAVKEHYRKVLGLMDRQLTINNVSSFERKMIHEVAEEMGLCHETSPDKKFIKIWRKLTAEQVSEKYAEIERAHLQQELALQKKKNKKKLQNENREMKNRKNPTGGNMFSQDIKELMGESSSEEEAAKEQQEKPEQAVQEKIEQPKGKKNKKKEKNKAKEEQKQQEEENIEELMKEFTANQPKQNECFKCKKRITSVTAVKCKFCEVHFCRPHLLAEEHGCDEAAKTAARSGNGQFDKKLKEAAERLKQKIKEQQDGRKRKVKQTKK